MLSLLDMNIILSTSNQVYVCTWYPHLISYCFIFEELMIYLYYSFEITRLPQIWLYMHTKINIAMHSYNINETVYRIALNFRGRKFLWFSWLWMESWKFFSRIFSHTRQEWKNIHDLMKVLSQIFILEQNSRNHESFLPRKFGAIRDCYNIVRLYILQHYANQISDKWLQIHAANIILRVHQYALIEQLGKCAYCMALGTVLLFMYCKYFRSYWIILTVTWE